MRTPYTRTTAFSGLLMQSCRYIGLLNMERSAGSRTDRIPRLLLFDIDGTLVTSHYKDPTSRHPVAQALTEAFGQAINIKRNSISFAGIVFNSRIKFIVIKPTKLVYPIIRLIRHCHI